MRIDWQEPKVVAITAILAIFIIGFFMGQIITGYSYKVPIALALGALIFIITLVNTDAGLAVLIFSMLLSPEIMVGQVVGRDIVIRFEDILLIVNYLSLAGKNCYK